MPLPIFDPMRPEPLTYFLKHTAYTGQHPAYYDPADFPWSQGLCAKTDAIRTELLDRLAHHPEYFQMSSYTQPNGDVHAGWSNVYFMNFGWLSRKNISRFPVTYAALKDIPGLSFAAIGLLAEQSEVRPHYGETNANIRCHLGVQVPHPLPQCGIRVNGEERGWQEGGIVMFSDCHMHATWNFADRKRLLVVFDVIKPEYAGQEAAICARYLAAQTLKYFDTRWPFLQRIPQWLLTPLHGLLTLGWRVYLPIQRRLPWLQLHR
jgi:ornithine lipid ester-linked acyl 2-hydroxylase